MNKPGLQRFSAIVYRDRINFCVNVPEVVSKAFQKRGYIPVIGRLNHYKIRATLVPTGGGRHRLFLNGAIRKAAGVGEGDRVALSLKLDTSSRYISVPVDLMRNLRRQRGALAAFKALPPSRRKEILVWILGAKRPDTRARRIAKAIDHILEQ